MPSSGGRLAFRLIGALVVLGASYVATLKLIDIWSPPVPLDPSTLVIEIVEATYGQNCRDFTPPAGYSNEVKPGNATAAVAQVCDKASESCGYLVKLARNADPAPGCAKDFRVSWRCGGDPTVHTMRLAAEADSKTAALSCPAP